MLLSIDFTFFNRTVYQNRFIILLFILDMIMIQIMDRLDDCQEFIKSYNSFINRTSLSFIN
jgi:hypothetical protein